MLQGWKLNSVANLQSALPWGISDSTNDISGLGTKERQVELLRRPVPLSSLGNDPIPYSASLTNPDCAAKAAGLDAGFAP